LQTHFIETLYKFFLCNKTSPQTPPMKHPIFLLKSPKLLFFTLLFSAAICLQGTAAGVTRYVSTSGDDTDNDCLDSANACATIVYAIGQADPGDTVEVAAGTYTEHGITLDKDLTINGHSASDTVVQAAATPGIATDRVFVINSGLSVTISGLTIANGLAAQAGGIYSEGSLTLNSCVVTGNSAVDSFVSAGGGIFTRGPLTISESVITGNHCTGIFGATGGGIEGVGDESLSITNSTISGNTAMFGAGLRKLRGTADLANCTISGNTAAGSAGGMEISEATVTLTNCTISGNTANGGGRGSGVHTIAVNGDASASLTLIGCTLTNNTGVGGAAIFTESAIAFPAVTTDLNDTLVAGNTGPNFVTTGTNASLVSEGYNLDSDGTSGFSGATDIVGAPASPIDAKLGPLQDNGGPTFTHELLTGSPAIDHGKNSSGSTTDQRGTGFARTFDNPAIANATGGDGTDIGAFEVQAAVCPQPQGFWKNNPNAWPVNNLTLGSQSYTKTELLRILRTSTGTGAKADASLILADQLIAAKLNIANGADGTPVTSTIAAADTVLSLYTGRLPYKVRTNTTNGRRMVQDGATLESYNNGLLTSGCGG
jgi:parallel beta-helix repeat protein